MQESLSGNLLAELRQLELQPVSLQIRRRYHEFRSFSLKSEEEWFCELCFCILTANSSAQMGMKVQDALGFEGFYRLPERKLSMELQKLGYRFYKKRAHYIVKARKHLGIKGKLSDFADDRRKRDYLFENVLGLGMKESSHFLRNTGHDNVAILDRHILATMHEGGLIPALPKHLTKKNYLEFESILDHVAQKARMNHSLLDLYLWYMRTGKVLK